MIENTKNTHSKLLFLNIYFIKRREDQRSLNDHRVWKKYE